MRDSIRVVTDPDIQESDPFIGSSSIDIGDKTFFFPLMRDDREEIMEMYDVLGHLRHVIRDAPDDKTFMKHVYNHKQRSPKKPRAINSEEGADKEKAEEAARRAKVIEEAKRHDAIEDADDEVSDYRRRTQVYVGAAIASLSVLVAGIIMLTLIYWPLGLGLTVPGAISSAFSVSLAAQRFNNNGIAERKKKAKNARRALRDFQT